MEHTTVLCIVGTTATGKSDLAVTLAKHCGGEVVSADSMQVYRGFDIGTAKITPIQMQGVPHHMLDVAEPADSYSVAQYCADAAEVIDNLHRRGKVAILAGGTGLYIDSLLSSLDFAQMDVDLDYRAFLTGLAAEQGNEAVWQRLKAVDPQTAENLHPNNLRRVIRALEVYRSTGRPMSQAARQAQIPPRFANVRIGLRCADREILYKRIDARVDKMMAQGLLIEVQNLLSAGVPRNCQAMQAIGFKELVEVIDGQDSIQSATDKIKQASRRYAKRQLTWFGKNPDIHWIDVDLEKKVFDKARKIVENIVIQ